MADLLTHVLVAYVLITVASWHVRWLSRGWIPVGMCGAAIPDLVKAQMVVDDSVVERLLGVPFSFKPLGTLGGLVLIAGAVAVLFGPEHRRYAYASLLAGGLSALVLDGMRMFADGRAGFWLYPLWWRPPTPNLYVSADPRVTLVAATAALVVLGIDRGVHEALVGSVADLLDT